MDIVAYLFILIFIIFIQVIFAYNCDHYHLPLAPDTDNLLPVPTCELFDTWREAYQE